MKFNTKAVHAGYDPDPITGSIMPPIYMTTTYRQTAPGDFGEYDYTRAGNPNFTILENLLSALEHAKHGTVFSSGLGALTGLISLLATGDIVVAIDGLYGGTYRLFTQVFSKFGIELILISPENLAELPKTFERKPKWLLFETPSNPMLQIHDIKKLSKAAKSHGILTIVDNTFATPYFQKPLDLGADIVWHSTTKYIGGHSDVVGGAILTNDKKIKDAMDFARKAIGINPSPFDAWLTTRGIKTLGLRMEQHQKNALQIAHYLEKHPAVKKVYYPGLKSHAGHHIAKKQMSGWSGVVTADFHFTLHEAKRFISRLSLFYLAESLGGVESLVDHPATMTHASIPARAKKKIGISDGLIRFSAGIEDPADLIDDLEKALKS